MSAKFRLLVLACLAVLAPTAGRASASTGEDVCNLINRERAKHGLRPVSLADKLTGAAQAYAVYMNRHNKFSHNADGRSPGQRISATGYKWSACGEIIAKGYPTPAAVVRGWMNSSGHRSIILGKSYTQIGVGTSGAYWVVDFAKPR